MSDLYQEKLSKFLLRVKPFRFVPFTDFVLGSGSLATGKIKDSSDFDVIVGVRYGRIFTNRFFAHVIFGLFGYRRSASDHSGDVKDKICLNHFVTPPGYKLKDPYNEYAKDLYSKLVPVMGDEDLIKYFFESNDWLSPKRTYKKDTRYIENNKSLFKNFWEFILGGFWGDWIEKAMRSWQTKRTIRGLPKRMPEGARFICTDEQIELHTDANMVLEKWQSRRNT